MSHKTLLLRSLPVDESSEIRLRLLTAHGSVRRAVVVEPWESNKDREDQHWLSLFTPKESRWQLLSSAREKGLGNALGLAVEHHHATRVRQTLEQQSKTRYVSGYHKAIIHLPLDETNKAFTCLEEAPKNRCEMMTWLKVDPAFDNIRRDLRFTKLLLRVGLEDEYQQSAAS